MADPGAGQAVSWLGFNTPTVGSVPPRSWLQVGLNNNGHPYLEYQRPGEKSVYQQAAEAATKLLVQVLATKLGWQISLNGKPWQTIKLPGLGQMFAGTELFDDSTARMSVGSLNSFENGRWVPFRHATKVGV